jgi:probable HAF family extracellular repeat protein
MLSVRTHRQAALFLVALVPLAAAVAAPTLYLATSIGTLPGGGSSKAYGINNAGDVVGWATDVSNGYNDRAVFFDGSTLVNLGMMAIPYGISSEAAAINAAGVIIGDAQNGVPHAFQFQAGQYHNLETLPGAIQSQPHALNQSGQIVGSVAIMIDQSTVVWHGFRSDGQAMNDLTAQLGGVDYSDAWGINSAGQIVGERRSSDGNVHAFLLAGATLSDLGTLGGGSSVATAINDAGQIAGWAYVTGNGSVHPFLYSAGQMTDIGLLPDALNGTASAINSAGVVVGTMRMPGYSQNTRAFLYSGGVLHDLNDLILPGTGWVLKAANSINDNGEIAGWGTQNGNIRGFVLHATVRGDLNCDGVANFADINPFVLALTNASAYTAAFPNCSRMLADLNADGSVDFADINPFVAVLSH